MVSFPNKVVFPGMFPKHFIVFTYVSGNVFTLWVICQRMLWKRIVLGNIFNETSCMFIRGSGRCARGAGDTAVTLEVDIQVSSV